MEAQGRAVRELREAIDRGERPRSEPPRNTVEPDLPLMSEEKRPQDPHLDGGDLRYEGYTFETREHAGEYPDTMPQVIEVTDPEGRKAAYLPLSRDGNVVDSSAVVRKLKDCEER
ncbi:hypothetical protein IVB29_23345 [Bradyrhizobium sp. 1]|nr:hypothetical protein [Bradyrhizobium sp. 1]